MADPTWRPFGMRNFRVICLQIKEFSTEYKPYKFYSHNVNMVEVTEGGVIRER